MEFYKNSYGDEFDKDKFISLQSLMKYTKGRWKSEKQANFLMKQWCHNNEDLTEGHWIRKFVPDCAGRKFISVGGYVTQSHGARGHVPVTYLYEVDKQGVITRWRVRYERWSKGGYSPKSVEIDWSREN
jgi:hypothetical protein